MRAPKTFDTMGAPAIEATLGMPLTTARRRAKTHGDGLPVYTWRGRLIARHADLRRWAERNVVHAHWVFP